MQASNKKARTDVAETDSITVNPNSMRLVYQRLQELEAELKRNGIPLPPSEALRQVLFGPRTPTVIWKLIFSFHTFQINPIDIISCENVPEEIKLREMCKTFHLALPIPRFLTVSENGSWSRRTLNDTIDLAERLMTAREEEANRFPYIVVDEIHLEAKEYFGGSELRPQDTGMFLSKGGTCPDQLTIIGKGRGKTILNGAAAVGGNPCGLFVRDLTWTNCNNFDFDEGCIEYNDFISPSIVVGEFGSVRAERCDFVGGDTNAVTTVHKTAHLTLTDCNIYGNNVRKTKYHGIEFNGGTGKFTNCRFGLGGSILVNGGCVDLYGAATSLMNKNTQSPNNSLGRYLNTRQPVSSNINNDNCESIINIHLPPLHCNLNTRLDEDNADQNAIINNPAVHVGIVDVEGPPYLHLNDILVDGFNRRFGEIKVIPLTEAEQTKYDNDQIIMMSKIAQQTETLATHLASGFCCVPEDYTTISEAMQQASIDSRMDQEKPFEIRLNEGTFFILFKGGLKFSRNNIKIIGKGIDKTFVRGGFVENNKSNVGLQDMTVTNPGGIGFGCYSSHLFLEEEKEDDATHITLNSVCISKCLHAIEVDSRREIKAVRCQFQNNVSSGVKIHMMSTGTFTDCVNHHNHIGYDIRESSHLTVQGDYSSIYKNTKYGIRCEELSLAVLKKNDVKTLLSVLNDNDDYYQHFIDNTNLTLDDLQNIDLESLMDIGLKRNHAKRVLLCVELANEQGTHNGFHQVHSNGKIGCEERNNVSATKGSYCLTHQKYKVIRMYIDSKFQELPPTDVGWSFDEVHNDLLESHELVELDLVKLVISRMCAEGALYSTVDSEHFNSTI